MAEATGTVEDRVRAAELLRRLVIDPGFRAEFQRRPADLCRQYGLSDDPKSVAKAMLTLEIRESKSSLAGALMASLAEGASLAELAAKATPAAEADAAQIFKSLAHTFEHHGEHHKPAHAGTHPTVAQKGDIPPLAPGARSGPGGSLAGAAPPAHADERLPGAASGADAPATTGQAGGDGTADGTAGGHAQGAASGDHAHDTGGGAGDGGLNVPGEGAKLSYPGDDASKEEIAAWMADRAERAGLPRELPLMAALTESGLANTPGGDRDSVGFFQMRVGIWNKGEYAGYPQNPELQLKWFIDHALAVKDQRHGAGDSGFDKDPSRWGDWIADVEQPAAQYRGRYQLQLDAAKQLLEHAQDSPGRDHGAEHAAHVEGKGDRALHTALKYLGTPYKWGGSSPATGFDCSGLVQYSYAHQGIEVPRVAEDQFHAGTAVPKDQLKPGDAVFFQDSTGYIHHVGLYVGDGRFLHAPHTGDEVKISSLSDPYFAQQFAGARRYAEAAADSSHARQMPVVSGSG